MLSQRSSAPRTIAQRQRRTLRFVAIQGYGSTMPDLPNPMPAQPIMQPYALLLETPSVRLGDDPSKIAWSGCGPLDVPLEVRGDGLVIFNFEETARFGSPSIPGWQPEYGKRMPAAIQKAEALRSEVGYARLEYMNAWLAAYGSGMSAAAAHGIISQPPVDPHRHFKAEKQNGRWIAFNERHTLVAGSEGASVVNTDVFEHAVAVMNAAEAKLGEGFTTTLALLHQASHQYVRHQFASAHLLGWTLTEQALHVLWRDYRISASSGPDAVTEINRDRRDLLDGRDFTASIITQILSLAGRISDERLTALDAARKARNNFAHKLKPIEGQQAQEALATAATMLSELLGVRVVAQLSNTFWM